MPLQKLKPDLYGVIKTHLILDIGIQRLSITVTKLLCDVKKETKYKV